MGRSWWLCVGCAASCTHNPAFVVNKKLIPVQFLKQSQRFTRNERKVEKAENGTHSCIPFEFRIAPRCFPSDGIDSQLAVLPPSLAVGEVCLDRHGNKCMQPLITYGLRAIVLHRPTARSPRLTSRAFREIVFSPWTEPTPPVSIEDFPGEFCFNAHSNIKARLSRCLLGSLAVSMAEPPPLISSQHGNPGSTRGLLKLELHSPRLASKNLQLPHWPCEITLEVVRKVYYSTMPLGEVASDRLMSSSEFLQKRTDVVHSNSWTVDPLSWDRGPLSQSSGKIQRNLRTASIPLTITPKRQLRATFSIPLVTLRYSLRVKLRILQVRHSELEVEAPLQVHSCRDSADAVMVDAPTDDIWPTRSFDLADSEVRVLIQHSKPGG